jgi:hypothetical protein
MVPSETPTPLVSDTPTLTASPFLPIAIEALFAGPVTPNPDLLQYPPPVTETVARAPIASLFDTNRYTGQNPWVTAEANIGIAEIANANFISENRGPREYPHPALANMEKYIGTYSKTGEKRAYYVKPGVGLWVNPVATECALEELTGVQTLCVDDDVWRETARKMLPRAVGYSAALLDYFFRGKLDIAREVDPASGLPSFRIVNRSPEELGQDGVLTLYQDNAEGIRSPVPGATLTLAAAVPKDNDAAPLYLPVPADLPAGGLTLVYRGPLGAGTGCRHRQGRPRGRGGRGLPRLGNERVDPADQGRPLRPAPGGRRGPERASGHGAVGRPR